MNEILEKYYNEGWVIKQIHPTKDLIIWNYSRATQWEKHWDEVTLLARGLVTNGKGKIIARGMKKFHNMEELDPSEIPNEPFEVTEKMDGQLGILFFYDNEWIFCSRGSFTSDYAKKGRELLEKYKYKKLDTRYTYLFEIIFKEGRIVCKYDFEDLIMISCFNNETGIEKLIHNTEFEGLGFKLVKKYDGINDFKVLKEMVSDDAEGYVIRFRSGLRMKIKGVEYCRLHSLITKISSRDIWKYLKDGKPLDDLIKNVPDEFYKWVKEKIEFFQKSFDEIKRHALLVYQMDIMPTEGLTRKEIAVKIQNHNKDYQAMFFHIYDNKDFSHLVWDKIYPIYEKPFNKNDEEGDN
jgi:RNA ligase